MRFFGITFCLIALGLTGYSALTFKAPKIEADIEARTARAVSAVADGEVDVRVDGRHVTLSGAVANDGQRLQVLSVVTTVEGALGPIDAFEPTTAESTAAERTAAESTAAPTAPYRFLGVKEEDGRVTIGGLAPSQEAKDMITAESRALFGDTVAVDIEIAAGAPSEDWQTAAIASLDALATLRQGKLSITDSDIVLEGDVTTDGGVDAIGMFAETMPEGFTWTHDVGVHSRRIEPFTFSVVKDLEGGLRLSGFAPDEETRAALIEQGKAVSGDKPVIADIRIADGMPDEEWPSLVFAGIDAIGGMEAGRYDVVGNDVSFAADRTTTAEDEPADAGEPTDVVRTPPSTQSQETAVAVATEEDAAAPADGPVDAALTPETSAPLPQTSTLTIDKVDDGVWSVRGVLPDQEAQDKLIAEVRKHADVEEIEIEIALAGNASDDDWLRYATDHIKTLNEVRAGRLTLDDYETHLIGVVETPEDIEPVEAAIAAVDETMIVDLQPIDPRPIAALDLALSPDQGLVLNGVLPDGMTEGEALLALGVRRHKGRIEEGGRGRAEDWRRDLSEIGTLLPGFERIALSLGGERPTIDGTLHAHGDADRITDQLVLALGADKEPLVNIETTAATHDKGERRTSPLSGAEEVYRQGFWLPVIEIGADANACNERSSAMQSNDKITFGRGQEDLDYRAHAILNELAGLAITCLDGSDMVLEIGGHTDSRGAAEMNRKLSQTRADAVLEALAARGVDTRALIAVGYGDQQPIADNATDEGRAKNRRITFEWKTSADRQG